MNLSDYCTRCGECCRHISGIEELKDFDSENGVCKFLDGNICRIFDNRPIVCNAERFYSERLSDKLTKDDFFELVVRYCQYFQNVKSSIEK